MNNIKIPGFLLLLLLIACQFKGNKNANKNHSEKKNESAIKAFSFSLSDVRLSPSWIRQKEDLNTNYLHQLDSESLLHNFRVNAGLPSSAKPLEGWESPDCGLRGHFTGHYLSACAAVIKSDGDSVLAKRISYMVDALAECQQKLGGKYLSAFPESEFDTLEKKYGGVWAPYYTYHKIMQGLLDVYELTGNDKAFQIVLNMADYVDGRMSKLPEAEIEKILYSAEANPTNEAGGMNEVLHNLYAVSKNPKYLKLAEIFDRKWFYQPLANNIDILSGLHSNTHIILVKGFARRYENTGEPQFRDAVINFWEMLLNHHAYVNGSSSGPRPVSTTPTSRIAEHWGHAGHLSATLTGEIAESCVTHNTQKLTANLFRWTAQPEYADAYLNSFYNAVLPVQNMGNGQVVYHLPLGSPRVKKFLKENDFRCCNGSGIEAFANLNSTIYFHNEDNLWVNLFIPSVLNWNGIRIEQQTKFPEEPKTKITISTEKPAHFVLNLLIPSWANAQTKVLVNGKPFKTKIKPLSFVSIDREWREGDTVELEFLYDFYMKTMPDNEKVIALYYGPALLAFETERELILKGNQEEILHSMSKQPGEFSLNLKSNGNDYKLVPLYQVTNKSYGVYATIRNEYLEKMPMKNFVIVLLFLLSINGILYAQHPKLFLLAGQSNAVGQGDSLTSLQCLPNTAFEFDAEINDFIPLKDPAGKPWKLFQRAGTGSVAPAFAKRLNELSNQKIYMVTAARGGASCSLKAEMADYDTWDTSGKLFDLAVEKTRMAEKKAGQPLSGIIWMQGERDANAILAGQMTGIEYQEALENLILRFRKEFGKKLPFYIVQTAYQQDKTTVGCDAVRNAQVAVAKKLKGVFIAYAETGEFAQRKWFKDNVHYNQEALNDIGTKTAEFVHSNLANNWTDNLDLHSMVQPVPQENKFIDPGYYVWCGSVTKSDDGKFYMLYSRWPLADGFEAWPVTSEIAVAVSNNPGGPFKHLKVALPARGAKFWDGSATHNPAVVKHDGKFYLFYMGTSCSVPIKKREAYTDNWWHYRNTQRIGVAVADKPDGDWKRLDQPILNVSEDSTAFDALMVSNPAATFDDKGRVILLYKQVCKTEKINGGAVRFGVAFADSPFGPFKKHDKPIFEINDGGKDWMVAEDPFVWFQEGTYLAIVRDVVGKFTGDEGAWALMVSKNGTDWQPAKHPKVIGSTFYWEGGVAGASKLERPCLYLENGIPKYLYGATRADKEQTLSFNVAVPLLENTVESLDFTKLIPKNPEKNIFSMPGYNVWCSGAVKGDDGKYHMFFSRWPESRGFDAWVTHSEVAHAVSDNLFGPYHFSDVCLPARGNQYWDGAMTHNPHIIRYQGKYYLYYTANKGSGYWDNTADTVLPKMTHPEWWVNRNNQRIGVAVADSPFGPWKRFDKPLIDITPGRRTTGVPTVFQRPDGKFSLAYKSVMEKEGYKGGAVKHYISLSDSPLGPFKDYDKPFITSPKSDFPIDDHVEWFQDGKYYCSAKDHGDMITEHGIALLLFESENGLDWTLSPNSLVHKFSITFKDGEHIDFERFEMPKVYLENGKVVALFLAAKPKGKEDSFSVVLPVNNN